MDQQYCRLPLSLPRPMHIEVNDSNALAVFVIYKVNIRVAIWERYVENFEKDS